MHRYRHSFTCCSIVPVVAVDFRRTAFAVVAAQAAVGLADGHRLAPGLLDFVEVVPPPLDGDQVQLLARRRRTARRRGRTTVSTSWASRQKAWFAPVRYRSMPTAARSPAATASTTDDGPVTASPPAKIHFSEVWPVTGLTWMNAWLRVSSVHAVADLLQVERLADGHQHLVGLDDEGVAAFFGPAAAGAVELAQPHGQALDARHALAVQRRLPPARSAACSTTPSCSASSISSS